MTLGVRRRSVSATKVSQGCRTSSHHHHQQLCPPPLPLIARTTRVSLSLCIHTNDSYFRPNHNYHTSRLVWICFIRTRRQHRPKRQSTRAPPLSPCLCLPCCGVCLFAHSLFQIVHLCVCRGSRSGNFADLLRTREYNLCAIRAPPEKTKRRHRQICQTAQRGRPHRHGGVQSVRQEDEEAKPNQKSHHQQARDRDLNIFIAAVHHNNAEESEAKQSKARAERQQPHWTVGSLHTCAYIHPTIHLARGHKRRPSLLAQHRFVRTQLVFLLLHCGRYSCLIVRSRESAGLIPPPTQEQPRQGH
uniref:Uncharacterized protein n=1 Tax=Craspedostauros australis TaxID=1486917 RepID=A0A7R9ZKF3_9STRA|mmetsp:Transcript_11324/g.31343  ORF Transcript_11324/g.31343 Transcript_11324/m.31343 type:complete len:302 (+) Transcript_11324:151-1056(+)